MPENDVKLTKLAKCAGCGAKVGAGVLAQLLDGIQVHRDPNLLVGFDKSDDASVYKVSDDLALVQTVDFFPPIADDPYLFGQIAATNALSDVYAMGGEPKLCLNIMAVPESMPKEAVHQLLRCGYDKAQGSDVELELEVDAIDLIPEALEFANMGLLPAGMYRNRAFAEAGVDAGETALCRQDLLYDPQTAGGLLMAVDPADAEALYRELQGCVPSAQRIGVVKAYRGGKRIFLR